MTEKTPEQPEVVEEYRSATQAAAIVAAPLVYHAADLAKDWVREKISGEQDDGPEVVLPSGYRPEK